jgi:hypothetical protein
MLYTDGEEGGWFYCDGLWKKWLRSSKEFLQDFACLVLLVQYQPARYATISQCANVCKKVCTAGLAQQKQSSYKTEGKGGGFKGRRGKHLLCIGWRNFFSSCAVVSVFCFPVVLLCQFFGFWFYILTYLEYNIVVVLC